MNEESTNRVRSSRQVGPRRNSFAFLLLALLLLINHTALAQQPVKVLATVGMVGDIAAVVGGDCAVVTTLMGPGVDPHLYRASAGDVRALQRADLILYAGYHLEGRLAQVLAEFSRTKPTVAVAEEAVPVSEVKQVGSSAYDPHLWMDVGLWAGVPDVIAVHLGELMPECAAAARERALDYHAQLDALNVWVATSVASIPEQERLLITAHDAFEYYGRAYGLEVVGVQGINTDSEAGLADIRNVANLIVEHGVPTIFAETSVNTRTVNAVRDAANSRGANVSLGPQLFSDAFGSGGTWQGTYIGMLVSNTVDISTSLGGSPAPLPAALAAWAEQYEYPGAVADEP